MLLSDSDVCLSDVCLSRTSGLNREQRGLGRPIDIGTEIRSPRHTCLEHHFQDQKVKGSGHQAALLTAALTREAGAAVTVRTYWAWETTATLRLLGGARGAGAPTEEERGGGISCRHVHSLFDQLIDNVLLECSRSLKLMLMQLWQNEDIQGTCNIG